MKTIGIYPGNFQPAHRGHVKVYNKLRQIVGPETFVATTSRTPTPDAPLNFGEKENIWVRHGIPASHVVKVNDWKEPKEIYHKFSPKHTSVVFALNPKEFESLNIRKDTLDSKEVWIGLDGSKSYFQPYRGNETKMLPFDPEKGHVYVYIIDDNMIDGKPISTSNVRKALGSPQYTEEQKKAFFNWAFGWFDIGLFQELTDKFKMAHLTFDPEQKPVAMPSLASLVRSKDPTIPTVVGKDNIGNKNNKLQQAIKEIVKEMLEQYMTPPPSMTPQGDSNISITLPGEEDRAEDEVQNRRNAVDAKRAAERDLKTMDSDLKWKKASVEKLRRDDLPKKRKEIDTLNKSIATGEPVSTSTTSTNY